MDSSLTPGTEEMPYKLLLVDDHPVVRAGLRVLHDIDPGLRIVGEADTVESALSRIAALSPDVVLLDVRLADEDGLEVCRRAKATNPGMRFLCLTSYADDDLVLAALAAGADGYLLKQRDAGLIAHAVREVVSGRTVFDPLVSRIVESGSVRLSPEQIRLQSLSPGEFRVLEGVALGWTDKEVAASLGLSSKTVRNCLDRVFAKLNVHTRTGAARIFAGSRRR